jgi:hypothetical protein
MPIVSSLMSNLVRQYGAKRGKRIYYALETARRGPFARGKKYAALGGQHGRRRRRR